MSEEQAPKTKKSWLPKLRLSTPGKAAIAMALSLLFLTALAWWLYASDANRVAWADYMTLSRGLTIFALFVFAVAATYWICRLWLEQIPAGNDSVEAAWKAGEQALASRGLSIQEMPVFVVLGTSDRDTQQNLMEASERKLLMPGVPQTESPLTWYVTQDAVYLFLSSAGLLGTVNTRIAALNVQRASVSQQLGLTESLEADLESGRAGTSSKTPLQRITELETAVASELSDNSVAEEQAQSMSFNASSIADIVTAAENQELGQKLTSFGNRLRSSRAPVAGLNGILFFVDAKCLDAPQQAVSTLGGAIRHDLTQLNKILGMQAPTNLLVGNMDTVTGVSDVVRRMGPAAARSQSVGYSAEPSHHLIQPDMTKIAERSVEAMRNRVVSLFESASLLKATGNERLVHCMLHLRQTLARSVETLLVQIRLAGETRSDSSNASFFSGLFFAANGQTPAERGFVAPVFSRLQSQQDMIAWSKKEKARQRRLKLTLRCIQAGFVAACLLLVLQFAFIDR